MKGINVGRHLGQAVFWLIHHKSVVLIEVLLLSMYPYALYCYFNFRDLGSVLIVLAFVFSMFLFIKSGAHIKNDILTKYVGFMCFFNLGYALIHDDTSYITRIVFSLTAFFFIYSLLQNRSFLSFIKFNTVLVTVQAILACIAFVLFFIGFIRIGSSFVSVDGRDCFSFGLSFSNMVMASIGRMSGYFDEPGALAFWGVYALLFNALFIKNKIIEYGLIIGLISTLSMAYFIQLAMYLLFFKSKNLKMLLPFAIVLFVGTTIIINSQNDNYLYRLTFERFENAANGKSSRTELAELAHSYFLQSPLIGNGAKKIDSVEYMNDNPYEIPAKDGILGTISIYLPLLIVFIGCKNTNVRFAVVILLVGYLQRPFHINLMHYLILYSFFIACEYTYGRKSYELFQNNNVKTSNPKYESQPTCNLSNNSLL